MWWTISDAGPAVAVVAAAAAVKLMDDVIDLPEDRRRGQRSWARRLGRGATAYALLFLAVGAAADAAVTVAFFTASYAWGMAGAGRARMPSGLPGWAETGLAGLLGLAAAGLLLMLAALAAVGAVHLLDDVVDRRTDPHRGAKAAAGFALALIGLALNPPLAALALAVGALAVGPLAGPGWRRGPS